MKKSNYELFVKVNDSKLQEYGSNGKTYIRGEEGRTFSLWFKNNTASRVLARLSVDGLSVLNGKDASKETSGYVCNAYSSIEISGWRTSMDEIRKFEFSKKEKSYVGKTTDSVLNCGVIGVQVFSEKKEKIKVIEKHIHHDHHHWENDWDHYNWPKKWPNYPNYPIFPYPIWSCGNTIYKCDTSCDSSSKMKSSEYNGNLNSNGINSGLGLDSVVKMSSLGGGVIHNSSTYNMTYGVDNNINNSMECSDNCEPDLSILRSKSSSQEVSDYNLGTKFGEKKSDSITMTEFEIGKFIIQMDIYYTDKEGLEKAGINLDKKPAIASFKSPTIISGNVL